MPAIASKYKRRGRSTIFETQADRTDAAIIKPSEGGTHFYGGNEVYLWPQVHGKVNMQLQSERKSSINAKISYYQDKPTLYTQTPEFLTMKN